ncbi:Phosphatase YidA [Hordeum vulgare]|nr:Phosphatase YidA [Hordeum vulgare]
MQNALSLVCTPKPAGGLAQRLVVANSARSKLPPPLLSLHLTLCLDVIISDTPHDRFLTHDSAFSARCAYSLLSSDHELDLNAGYMWGSKAPIRVKIFGWLLCRDRLSMMANLHRKTITYVKSCPRSDFSSEDRTHLSLLCPCVAQVWSLLGLHAPHSIDGIWDTFTLVDLDINIWPTVALVIL